MIESVEVASLILDVVDLGTLGEGSGGFGGRVKVGIG